MDLCGQTVSQMNKGQLNYAIAGFSPDLYFDENGKPAGLWIENMKVLEPFMNFTPVINTNVMTFTEHTRLVEEGNERIGSPQVASFQ